MVLGRIGVLLPPNSSGVVGGVELVENGICSGEVAIERTRSGVDGAVGMEIGGVEESGGVLCAGEIIETVSVRRIICGGGLGVCVQSQRVRVVVDIGRVSARYPGIWMVSVRWVDSAVERMASGAERRERRWVDFIIGRMEEG